MKTKNQNHILIDANIIIGACPNDKNSYIKNVVGII